MEALPRLPMLSFEFRAYYPKNGQFGPDLMNLIRQYYQEDPSNYTEEIQQLEKLRQQVMKINKDIEGCNLLKRYFCQLYFLQKRFPMLKDASSVSDISWKDVLTNANSKKIDYRNEFTVTLYNIGALHTMLGAADDRTTSEGLKLACTHFQCAAWAFTEITAVNVRSDFDPGFLQFLIPVCLAQAQECIAEKSITDNRKPSISAKVVTQICEYYGTAMNALSLLKQEDSIIIDCGMKNSHAWMNYLKFKKPYYECITNLFLGMVAEEEEKMGERVAYFELASEKLNAAFHYIKYIDVMPLNKGLDEALTFTRDVVEGKRKNAVNENEFIYHSVVPPKDNLQKVNGAVLVKCIGFDFSDPEISGPDIFSKLISMKVHKLSSVYSEEKAKLLRSVSASVEEKESELNYVMQSFKLDYLNPPEDPNALPEELIERCAACEAKSNIVQDLISSMNTLADAHHEIDSMMKEVIILIEQDEKAEEEYQAIMNTTRPPSIVATDLKCEANRYLQALKTTTESNESLRNAISAHVNNLRILALPLEELEKQLPCVSFDYSPEERDIVKELQRLVDKVEEMKTQRALLMLQLRDSLRNDDITDQLAITDEDKSMFPAMVQKEIGKHQNVVNLIEQNLKAQSNILKAITNSYAAYAPIRKIITETAHKRGVQINALIESFDVSGEVLQKTAKGLDFYRKLEANVRKLLTRVKGTCKVQEEERQQIYAKAGKKPIKKDDKISDMPEKPTTVPAAPKLKDYIVQKQLNRNVNEVSLPYNPYYSNPASGYGPPAVGHGDENRGQYPTSSSTSVVDMNQYYATVTRPQPVGSETTVGPPAPIEPSIDLKSSVMPPATGYGSATSYPGYSYPYYTATGSYQSLPTSYATSSPNNYTTSTSYTGAQESTYAAQSPASLSGYSVKAPAANYAAYNYSQSGYNTPQPNASVSQQPVDSDVYNYNKGFTSYSGYSSSQTSNLENSTANATKPEVNVQNVYSHTRTNLAGSVYAPSQTYVPITSNFSNVTASVANSGVNTYAVSSGSAAYSATGYAAVNTIQTNENVYGTMIPATYSTGYYNAGSVPAANTGHGGASYYSPGTVPVSNTGASNVAYSATQAPGTHVNAAFAGTNLAAGVNGQAQTYSVNNASVPYSTTAYIAAGTPNTQNVYNNSGYYNQTNYGYNAAGVAGCPSGYDTANYQYGNAAGQQPQRANQVVAGASDVPSTTVSYVSVGAFMWNSTRYTNAGHHNTENIESSSKSHDGRSYAVQYASNNETSTSNGDADSQGQQYFTSQYGSQYAATSEDSNAENFVSRENEQTGDRLQAKRNSMTYMQAGSAGNKNTTSTFVNGKGATTTPTEGKPKSNLDLLADLDFDVSDRPLLPISEAAAANKIIEKLTNLNMNASATEKKDNPAEIKLKVPPTEDSFADKNYVSKFLQEAEKFEKFVEKLTLKTLNGSIPLDSLWNEYTMQQDKFSKMRTTSEAQKYSDKNRSMNAVPYDSDRVILSSAEPNYINASLIRNINPSTPDVIVTQAPISSTISDFWCMIWDQEVEFIVCLLTDQEMNSGDLYWPREKNEKLKIGNCVITLHSVNVQAHSTERLLSVLRNNVTRIVIHTQLSSWREESCGEISNPTCQVLTECVSAYYALRNLQHPIVVHCDYGIGRTGIFTLLIAFICDVQTGRGVPDLMAMLMLMSEGRKNLIKDKQHLLCTFQLALCYVQSVLVKCGLRSVPEAPKEKMNVEVENACNTDALPDVSAFRKVASKPEMKQPDRLLSKEENKRRNMELFSAGGNLESMNESMTAMPDDPLSSIDPLWPIKKEQS